MIYHLGMLSAGGSILRAGELSLERSCQCMQSDGGMMHDVRHFRMG